MIDNYDSFTYNLVHYFRGLGQQVETFRNDQITIEQLTNLSPEFIVISPGPCDPNQAGISLDIIKHFVGKTPILGVCLGHQCIAQYFGAVVVKAKKVMHGKTSKISHNEQGLFQTLKNPLQVTRYHSLVIDKQSLPECLEVTAWSDAGKDNEEIMAIKHKTHPIVGVQFHPESILTEQGISLLKNFISQYTL